MSKALLLQIRTVARDERGQGETVSWTLAQVPFWVLVAILVAVVMLGLRRASAVLAVHNAGLVSGRVDAAAGQSAAEHVLSVWWGDETAPVHISESSQYRSVQAQLEAQWDTAAGQVLGPLSIRASTWGRKELFYAGPPDEDGFE
ncbi:MAG: hypothetical protein PVF45_06655 [Anaerolineae bacterium]|jgi:hypothetical protein